MQTKTSILKAVKVTLIAIATLVSIVSVEAQGLISQNANTTGDVISGDVNFIAPVTYGTPISSDPSPITDSSDVAITAAAFNLTDVNFGNPVNLSAATIVIGQVDFNTAVTYGGNLSGAGIEASRPTTGISEFPIFPPSPDSQIQFAQASEIQPAPEPSTFALGSLAFGLIAFFRASVKAKNVA